MNFEAKKVWGPIPPAPIGTSWEKLMDEALSMAMLGAQKGEIPVGAVLVDSKGYILAKAHNETITTQDPTAHAEIVVLRQGAKRVGNHRLLDTYLLVTLEPCIMCTGAIREARIAGLVYGAHDLQAGAVDSCFDGLNIKLGTTSKTWHMGGVKAEQCCTLLQSFFQERR